MPAGGVVSASAIGGSSLIGGATSLFGGKAQADAQKQASSDQLQATKLGIQAQQQGAGQAANLLTTQNDLARQFLTSQNAIARSDLAPFRETGLAALKAQYDLATNPLGDAFQRQQTTDTIANSLASRGLLRSGALGQNLATLEGGLNAQRFDRLSAISNAGAGASSGLASLASSLGSNVASGYQNTGQGLANIYGSLGTNTANLIGAGTQAQNQFNIGATGAQVAGFTGASNALTSGVGNFLLLNQLNKIGAGGTNGSVTPWNFTPTNVPSFNYDVGPFTYKNQGGAS